MEINVKDPFVGLSIVQGLPGQGDGSFLTYERNLFCTCQNWKPRPSEFILKMPRMVKTEFLSIVCII